MTYNRDGFSSIQGNEDISRQKVQKSADCNLFFAADYHLFFADGDELQHFVGSLESITGNLINYVRNNYDDDAVENEIRDAIDHNRIIILHNGLRVEGLRFEKVSEPIYKLMHD